MARAGFPAVAIPPSAARDVQIAVQNIRARLEALESSYAPSKTVNAQIASVSAQIGTSSSSSSSSGIADALSNGIPYGRENASWVQVLPQPIASSTNAAYDIVFYDGTSAALISSALTFNPSTKALSIGGTLQVTGTSGTTLYTTGVALGGTAGNSTLVANFNYLSANNDQLQVSGYRATTGTSWSNAQLRLEKIVDVTHQGYIYFGDGGTGTAAGIEGLILGSTGKDALYINGTGNVSIPAPTSGTALTVAGNENVTGTLTVTGDVFAPNILNFTASASAPGSPNVGDRWVNTSNGVQYTWFNDGSGNQWVQFT